MGAGGGAIEGLESRRLPTRQTVDRNALPTQHRPRRMLMPSSPSPICLPVCRLAVGGADVEPACPPGGRDAHAPPRPAGGGGLGGLLGGEAGHLTAGR